MKERPIIFSAPMVRAILEGRKTQTRRVVKPQPEHGLDICPWSKTGWAHQTASGSCTCNGGMRAPSSPYGNPADRLWVRETWQDGNGGLYYAADGNGGLYYAADGNGGLYYAADGVHPGPWKSPIHMPRWSSRITLEVVGVRVERLQQISEEDARAEGVASVAEYAVLWDSIHGKDSWMDNPWVWVIEFKRIDNTTAANAAKEDR